MTQPNSTATAKVAQPAKVESRPLPMLSQVYLETTTGLAQSAETKGFATSTANRISKPRSGNALKATATRTSHHPLLRPNLNAWPTEG